jgi:hypothetical protein
VRQFSNFSLKLITSNIQKNIGISK